MLRSHLLLSLLLFPSMIFGQVAISGVPFLQIVPGPGLYLNNGAFTALPSDDPYASWANPAQISNVGNGVGVGFFTSKTNWLPFNPDLTYHSTAFVAGGERGRYRYGVGLLRTLFDYGEQEQWDSDGNSNGTFTPKEFVNALSVGAGVDFGVQLNTGFTFKLGESRLGPSGLQVGNIIYQHAPIRVADIGVQLVYPTPQYLGVSAELAAGYAIRNFGGTLSYNHPDSDNKQEDSYPRSQNIGYSAALRHSMNTPGGRVETVRFDVSVDIEDLLVDPRTPTTSNGRFWRYTGIAGDVRFWDHFVMRDSDDRITIRQGWRVELFETIRMGKGWMNGPGFGQGNLSDGFEFDITRLADFALDIRSPLRVTYSSSNYELGNFQDSRPFKGLIIRWDLN